jgi:tetratricopeptide (TPR) repeat protein
MSQPPPSSSPTPESLAAEVSALEGELARSLSGEERDRVKRRLVLVLQQAEAAHTLLVQTRERIRDLIERYKRDQGVEETPGVRLGDGRPPIRSDHLGASTFIEKGWSLIALGDQIGAIQALTRALELAPDDLQAKSLLGWAQMLDHQLDQALATFSVVLAAEPANTLARVNVGYICLKKRIFGEAIEHLSRVIRLDNDRKGTLYAHYYLGLVYLEREMYLDAQTFLAKAIALGPNLIEAYYDLGRAQWFAGDRDGAKQTWGKGAAANRFAPWSKRCRDLLEAVERGGVVPRSSPSA